MPRKQRVIVSSNRRLVMDGQRRVVDQGDDPCQCCDRYYRLFYCGDDTYSGLTLTAAAAAAGHLSDIFRRTADDVCYYINGTTTVPNDAGGGTWYASCAACTGDGGDPGGGGCDPSSVTLTIDPSWNLGGGGAGCYTVTISSADGGELCVNSRGQIRVTAPGTFTVSASYSCGGTPGCFSILSAYYDGALVAGPLDTSLGTPTDSFVVAAGDVGSRVQIWIERCFDGGGTANGDADGYHDDFECRAGVGGCPCDTDDLPCCPEVDAYTLPSSVQYGSRTLTWNAVTTRYEWAVVPGFPIITLDSDASCCGWVLRDSSSGGTEVYVKGWECDPRGVYRGKTYNPAVIA